MASYPVESSPSWLLQAPPDDHVAVYSCNPVNTASPPVQLKASGGGLLMGRQRSQPNPILTLPPPAPTVSRSGSVYSGLSTTSSSLLFASADAGGGLDPDPSLPSPSTSTSFRYPFLSARSSSSPNRSATLSAMLALPDTLYGIIRREKAKQANANDGDFPRTASTGRPWLRITPAWSHFVLVLQKDTLYLFHVPRGIMTASSLSSLVLGRNGPYQASDTAAAADADNATNTTGRSGAAVRLADPRSENTYSTAASPPPPPPAKYFSARLLARHPTSCLKIVAMSEAYVCETGIYVLKVTGRRVEPTATSSGTGRAVEDDALDEDETASIVYARSSVGGSGNGRVPTGGPLDKLLEDYVDNTWLIQFDRPESMMTWMSTIRKCISRIK
ncbi:hypothetical protein HDU84_009182 [Entophlyctis sp. JEL0112]|nr:hypothetical protein HDU84_009182 [Entophlyctis sp. JEL0112]